MPFAFPSSSPSPEHEGRHLGPVLEAVARREVVFWGRVLLHSGVSSPALRAPYIQLILEKHIPLSSALEVAARLGQRQVDVARYAPAVGVLRSLSKSLGGIEVPEASRVPSAAPITVDPSQQILQANATQANVIREALGDMAHSGGSVSEMGMDILGQLDQSLSQNENGSADLLAAVVQAVSGVPIPGKEIMDAAGIAKDVADLMGKGERHAQTPDILKHAPAGVNTGQFKDLLADIRKAGERLRAACVESGDSGWVGVAAGRPKGLGVER